jgi:Tol biopolymer transport system component
MARTHLFPSSAAAGALAFTAVGPGTTVGIVPARGGPSVTLVDTAFDDEAGTLSPDGRLLAYQSDESGRWEIYTLRIADRQRAAVSAGGGTAPFWSRDGKVLYYTSAGNLMRTAIDAAGNPGNAVVATALDSARAIGATPDGRVLLVRDSVARPKEAVVTLEWVRELRRILGPPSTALPR